MNAVHSWWVYCASPSRPGSPRNSLLRFFETRTLALFVICCVAAGVVSFVVMLIIG